MIKSKLEASIGMSRKWDAYKAGQEVARSTIKKLNSPPNFFNPSINALGMAIAPPIG